MNVFIWHDPKPADAAENISVDFDGFGVCYLGFLLL